MAKKSQCEQCDKYIQERELCRKIWKTPVFDDNECELLKKGNDQLDTEEQKANQSHFQNNNSEETFQREITVNGAGIYHMQEIAKWTRFLAIVATIEMTLMTLVSIAIIVHGAQTNFIGLIYIIIIAICFYPIKKAFDLAGHMKNSALQTDSEELECGLDDLRGILKYMGILTIIMMVPYALFIIVVIIGGIGVGIASLFQ
jgi:hypothetical protein